MNIPGWETEWMLLSEENFIFNYSSATEPSPSILKAEHLCVLLLWPAVSGWKTRNLAVRPCWAPRQSSVWCRYFFLPLKKEKTDKQIYLNVMVSMCSKYFLVLELNPFCESMSKYIKQEVGVREQKTKYLQQDGNQQDSLRGIERLFSKTFQQLHWLQIATGLLHSVSFFKMPYAGGKGKIPNEC